MISIRKSVDDLDRLNALEKREDLSANLLECYTQAVDSTSQYSVELEPGFAVDFRTHLAGIAGSARAARTAEELGAVQSSFRGELRDYRDRCVERLKKMRKELEDATAAMQIFAETMSSTSENHEHEVTASLRNLESVSKSTDIEVIRAGIGSAVSKIESSVLQMQTSNRMMAAQFEDELSALHRQLEEERRALYTDRESGAWNRQKIDNHLENLLRQSRPFCLLLVWVRNLKRLETQHSRNIVEGTLKALISRFTVIAADEGVIGRWSKDQFVAVLDMPAARAMTLSAQASAKLSGTYAVQENGLAHNVTIHATAGIIERPAGLDTLNFHEKLEQLSAAISGA